MNVRKEAIDQAAHAAMGVLLALPVAPFAPWWACALTGLVGALYREDAQHRPREGWRWLILGSTRWLDIAIITLGACAVGFWRDFA